MALSHHPLSIFSLRLLGPACSCSSLVPPGSAPRIPTSDFGRIPLLMCCMGFVGMIKCSLKVAKGNVYSQHRFILPRADQSRGLRPNTHSHKTTRSRTKQTPLSVAVSSPRRPCLSTRLSVFSCPRVQHEDGFSSGKRVLTLRCCSRTQIDG